MTNKFENYCCDLRKKVVITIAGLVTKEACGVSDMELADVTLFDEHGNGVVHIRYCPWCGLKLDPNTPKRVTNPLK